MANLNQYITEQITGKCFRERNSSSEIVQIVEFKPSDGDRSSRAGVRVWYPLTDTDGFIDSDVFENYVPCSATEIERIRRLGERAQSPPKCGASGKFVSLASDHEMKQTLESEREKRKFSQRPAGCKEQVDYGDSLIGKVDLRSPSAQIY